MFVRGYRSTIFHHQNLVIKLKIPDFQLEAIFSKIDTKKPIIVDKIYSAFLGVHFEIKGRLYSLPLPLSHENFESEKNGSEYLLDWWEWFKPQRATELLDSIKSRKDTLTSIALNEESSYLDIEPLKTFILNKKFENDFIDVRTVIFPNIQYQEYRKAIHHKTTYGKNIKGVTPEIFRKDIKYSKYPRLYRSPIKKGSRIYSPLHAFVNYGTHTEDFIKSHIQKYFDDHKHQLKDEESINKAEVSNNFDLASSIEFTSTLSPEDTENFYTGEYFNKNKKLNQVQTNLLMQRAEENYKSYYSNSLTNTECLPITLIADQVSVEYSSNWSKKVR